MDPATNQRVIGRIKGYSAGFSLICRESRGIYLVTDTLELRPLAATDILCRGDDTGLKFIYSGNRDDTIWRLFETAYGWDADSAVEFLRSDGGKLPPQTYRLNGYWRIRPKDSLMMGLKILQGEAKSPFRHRLLEGIKKDKEIGEALYSLGRYLLSLNGADEDFQEDEDMTEE